VNGTWTTISGATGNTFTPGTQQVGRQVRAVASYVDGGGFTEVVASQQTAIVGNSNANSYGGTPDANLMLGLDGNDTLAGGAEADTLEGGAGNDVLGGDEGDDVFRYSGATSGFDAVDGGAGFDTIQALAANTVIGLRALSGVEAISANGFANVVIRGSDVGPVGESLDFSNVVLTGIAGIDGGGGHDTLTGSAGADTISGGSGNDVLNGGAGNDRLSGDGGNDVFVFAPGTGRDTITGFVDGQDRIELRGVSLTSLVIDQVGSDTVIQSGSDILVLEGVLRSAITDSDFLS
jgi:Ca2+-binding RTX toxin-like protein